MGAELSKAKLSVTGKMLSGTYCDDGGGVTVMVNETITYLAPDCNNTFQWYPDLWFRSQWFISCFFLCLPSPKFFIRSWKFAYLITFIVVQASHLNHPGHWLKYRPNQPGHFLTSSFEPKLLWCVHDTLAFQHVRLLLADIDPTLSHPPALQFFTFSLPRTTQMVFPM